MQIKVGATLYPFPTRPMELGDQRLLKREYGFVPGRDEIDWQDPDHLAGFLYAAMREADVSDTPGHKLVSRINRVRVIEVVGDDGQPFVDGEDVDEPDPTPPAPTVAEAVPPRAPTVAEAVPPAQEDPPPSS